MPEGPENAGRFRNGSHGQVNLYTNFSGGGRNLWGPDLIQVFQSAGTWMHNLGVHAQQQQVTSYCPVACVTISASSTDAPASTSTVPDVGSTVGSGAGVVGMVVAFTAPSTCHEHFIFIHHAPRWCPIHINAPTIGLSSRVHANP